jgi:hypothetical protein
LMNPDRSPYAPIESVPFTSNSFLTLRVLTDSGE